MAGRLVGEIKREKLQQEYYSYLHGEAALFEKIIVALWDKV